MPPTKYFKILFLSHVLMITKDIFNTKRQNTTKTDTRCKTFIANIEVTIKMNKRFFMKNVQNKTEKVKKK